MYKEISKKTFDLLVEKRVALIKVLLIPFILLSIIENYLPSTHFQISSSNLSLYLLIILSLIVSIFMSISVHRVLLLPENQTSAYGSYSLSKRFWSFFIKGILLALLIVIFGIFAFFIISIIASIFESSWINAIIVAFVFIALAVLFSRISLVFPAAAIDKEMDFSEALALTSKHKTLVFFTVVIIPLFLAILLGFVYGMAIEFLMTIVSQKLKALYSLLNIFTTVFMIAFLSTTYEYIMNVQPKKEENPLEEPEFIKGENTLKIKIDDRYDLSFQSLKEELYNQYEKLGFTFISFDKEDSWMIKKPEFNEAYILLSYKDSFYNIETFNVSEEPSLDLKS